MRWIFPCRTIGLLRLERPFEIIKSPLRTDHVGNFGVLVAWLFSRQILKHHFNPRWCSLLPGLPLGLQECQRGGEEPGCSAAPPNQVPSSGSCYSSFLPTAGNTSPGPHLADHLPETRVLFQQGRFWCLSGTGKGFTPQHMVLPQLLMQLLLLR